MSDARLLTEKQVSGQVLDHLGLVSATLDKMNLIQAIDERLPVSQHKGAKITMGERVAAMILNGLGFMDTRLYMFPEFLANKPVQRLFGSDLNAKDFNDDCLGRALDAIYDYGVTRLFSDLAFKIGSQQGLLGKSAHIDTTSLTVYGDYEQKASLNSSQLQVTYGYSKDHRPDLKQVVLNLATTGASGFPLWMESHSGNVSDKTVLKAAAKRMQAFSQSLKEAPSFLYVADSAMYESCLKDAGDLLWLSRVPERLKTVKALLGQDEDCFSWQDQGGGYRTCFIENRYRGVHQRWCIVSSEQALKRETKTLNKAIEKASIAVEKALWHLSCQSFACEIDAEIEVKKFKKTLRYHQFDYQLVPIKKQAKRGRPKKGVSANIVGYQITGKLTEDKVRIKQIRCTKGRFIIATNALDKHYLPDLEMLSEYKAQSKTETGFKFIKDNAFEVSAIFLKKPSRIAALMMVMTLCLMVYRVAQHHLQQSLSAHPAVVPDQTGRPTAKPTLKRVFKLFQGVHVLTIDHDTLTQELVINLNVILKQIIGCFGPKAMCIYGISATTDA